MDTPRATLSSLKSGFSITTVAVGIYETSFMVFVVVIVAGVILVRKTVVVRVAREVVVLNVVNVIVVGIAVVIATVWVLVIICVTVIEYSSNSKHRLYKIWCTSTHYIKPQTSKKAPVTLASAIMHTNVEFLAGIDIAQFAKPGTPIVYSSSRLYLLEVYGVMYRLYVSWS
jgi:lysylphosphatidylglycerol synthetase-like protein (DUF2156 family)